MVLYQEQKQIDFDYNYNYRSDKKIDLFFK